MQREEWEVCEVQGMESGESESSKHEVRKEGQTSFSCSCISAQGGTGSCKQLGSEHTQLSMRTGFCAVD